MKQIYLIRNSQHTVSQSIHTKFSHATKKFISGFAIHSDMKNNGKISKDE